jgi:hypothetical protein
MTMKQKINQINREYLADADNVAAKTKPPETTNSLGLYRAVL